MKTFGKYIIDSMGMGWATEKNGMLEYSNQMPIQRNIDALDYSMRGSVKMSIQKGNLIEVIPKVVRSVYGENDRIIVGEYYSLQGVSCDGNEMSKKTYIIKGIVNNYQNIPINCVVAKQVSGNVSTIFELTRNLCSDLGIEYENGLQLLPLNLNWKHDASIQTFNPNDLSTYPFSGQYLQGMVIRLKGFNSYRSTNIITSNDEMMLVDDFKRYLTVSYAGIKLKFDIITKNAVNGVCDREGNIDLLVYGLRQFELTKEKLKDVSSENFFFVYWLFDDRPKNNANDKKYPIGTVRKMPLYGGNEISEILTENGWEHIDSTDFNKLVRENKYSLVKFEL